jgi:DNA-binding IclR family transcriptional regulator
MRTDNRAKAGSQTLARGLRLLDLIANANGSVSIRELAAATALPRTIVQRLLYTLESEGLLERDPQQGGYRLSLKLWTFGCAAIRRLDVREVARPFLQDLARKSNEMVKLGVLDGTDVVYIDSIESPQAVRAYVPVGGRAPAHASATGKAVLAFVPRETLPETGVANQRYTEKTVVGSEAFAREMEQIRRRGYAVNRGEWAEDVGAVAAPVFDAHGIAIGSVGLILPAHRLTAAKALQMGAWVTAAGNDISARLGYRAGVDRTKLKRA